MPTLVSSLIGMKRIYLDNHATTPVDPRVVEAMLPWFTEQFGNPASKTHAFGWEAEEAVDRSRQTIAKAIGAPPRDIVFVSGATEANNLAIKGAAEAVERGDHVVSTAIEHKCVLDSLNALERRNVSHTLVAPMKNGIVDPAAIRDAITDRTFLVSVMAANNEIGTLQPLREIGEICRVRGVLFHSDAAQLLGRVPIDVERDRIDLLSVSAHKVYGPKGVGALYVRSSGRKIRLAPQIHGGGHEGGHRSGTLNVPGIVGFARAIDLAVPSIQDEQTRLRRLRDRLHAAISAGLDGVVLNGDPDRRLAGNLNLSFAGVDGESLMMTLQELAVSSGSACRSASLEPSHVLRAIGLSEELALASVRFGLGRFNDEQDVTRAAEIVVARVRALRAMRGTSPGHR